MQYYESDFLSGASAGVERTRARFGNSRVREAFKEPLERVEGQVRSVLREWRPGKDVHGDFVQLYTELATLGGLTRSVGGTSPLTEDDLN